MRWVALAEATSFIALLIASLVKRTGGDELGVQILGPIHGLLFIAYLAIALGIREEMGWSGRTTFWVLVGAVVPFGGYVVDWKLLRDRPPAVT
jgi:integral membrane protein